MPTDKPILILFDISSSEVLVSLICLMAVMVLIGAITAVKVLFPNFTPFGLWRWFARFFRWTNHPRGETTKRDINRSGQNIRNTDQERSSTGAIRAILDGHMRANVAAQDALKSDLLKEMRSVKNSQTEILQSLTRIENWLQGRRDTTSNRDPLYQGSYRDTDKRLKNTGPWSQGQLRSASSARLPSSYDSRFDEFSNSYNSGVEDPDRRKQFRDRYTMIRIGTANAMERYKDRSLQPEFQMDPDGDYYAIEIKGGGRRCYAVVPVFDLMLDEDTYGPGAMGRVFECPGYISGDKYGNLRVRQPAIFVSETDQRWLLEKPGTLDLGSRT